MIRPAVPFDFEQILALNREWERYLSPVDHARLVELDRKAAYHRVVQHERRIAAFLLVFREGSDYDSANYRWFAERYERFLYVDRVVVGSRYQRKGFGVALYRDLFDFAREARVERITCEYDLEPKNEVSERFHQAFGFEEVATRWVDGGKKRVTLQSAPVV